MGARLTVLSPLARPECEAGPLLGNFPELIDHLYVANYNFKHLKCSKLVAAEAVAWVRCGKAYQFRL
jgi:hypothetical protein